MSTPDMAVGGYPLFLNVRGLPSVVVGGGPVAARRARSLAEAGSHVTLVAPELAPQCVELLGDDLGVRWLRRPYQAGDCADAWLVHTATGDIVTDNAVADEARERRVWCVRADDAAASRAWTPAVARVDDVVVAVNSAGDPKRAARIRSVVQAGLETGEISGRQVRRGAKAGGEFKPGEVVLVGGGPGDPGLITTLGRRMLADADVVVADRLGPRSLLGDLDPDVEVIEVGKSAGNHPVPQDEINRILVARAQAGQRVVRLKGGDSYVFGRGGEEVAACQAAGVSVRVIPGVTSAFSVPAAVGVPVTHRGLAKQVTVVSGHEPLDEATVATTGTIVMLMGVSQLTRNCDLLLAAGRSSDTPVAIIEDGFGPGQRLTTGTLTSIAAAAASAGVKPPAIIVIGDVAGLAS